LLRDEVLQARRQEAGRVGGADASVTGKRRHG
jgi:hypothetical protein